MSQLSNQAQQPPRVARPIKKRVTQEANPRSGRPPAGLRAPEGVERRYPQGPRTRRHRLSILLLKQPLPFRLKESGRSRTQILLAFKFVDK